MEEKSGSVVCQNGGYFGELCIKRGPYVLGASYCIGAIVKAGANGPVLVVVIYGDGCKSPIYLFSVCRRNEAERREQALFCYPFDPMRCAVLVTICLQFRESLR